MASPAVRGVAAEPAVVVFAHEGRDWIRGSEQCLLDLVRHLDRDRFRPVVFCDAPTLAREAVRLGADVTRIEAWGGGPIAPRAVRERVQGALREHGAALVHATSTVTLPAVLPAARALRRPVVAHLHLPMSAPERLHTLLHQTTVAVGVAEHVVADLRREGMPAAAVRVIPNAVDAERLGAGDARGLRAALGIAAEAWVATSIGSLIHRKGHDRVIAAVAAARADGAPLHLLVCGDGEEAGALRALAESLGVADAVHFLGLRADVGAILRDATDVYVSGAREEALPLNVLEAQWAGRAVVCSDIAAHREAIRPGVTGVLVPGDQPRAYAGAITALAADPERRAAMGAAGRALAAERFSMPAYTQAFEALYDELLAAPPGAYGWVRASRWPHVYSRWLVRAGGRRLGLPRGERSR